MTQPGEEMEEKLSRQTVKENEMPVNILLVDDQPNNLLALESILDILGQNLVRANSGEEALRLLIQKDFAVVLLDVLMPGMDGFETAGWIRHRDRSRHTPIIFLTGGGKTETEMFQGYAAGAIDYLLKPFVPEVLRSKVAILVDLYRRTEELRSMNEELKLKAKELVILNMKLEIEKGNRDRTVKKLFRSEESLKNLKVHPEPVAVGQTAIKKTKTKQTKLNEYQAKNVIKGGM